MDFVLWWRFQQKFTLARNLGWFDFFFLARYHLIFLEVQDTCSKDFFRLLTSGQKRRTQLGRKWECALKLKHCNCLLKIMGPFNPSEWFRLKCSTTILFFDGSILELLQFLWKVTEIKSVPRCRKFAIRRISKLGRMIWLAKVCLRWVTAETFLIISASRRINPWLMVCCRPLSVLLEFLN